MPRLIIVLTVTIALAVLGAGAYLVISQAPHGESAAVVPYAADSQ